MSTFSDISNNPSSWYIVTDQVMGGKSELELVLMMVFSV
jgi:hypothetical protein